MGSCRNAKKGRVITLDALDIQRYILRVTAHEVQVRLWGSCLMWRSAWVVRLMVREKLRRDDGWVDRSGSAGLRASALW